MKTTDPQDELFDTVDINDTVTGVATRAEVHSNKTLIHRAVTILVYKEDTLLLQKRSGTKDMYPNYWTASCSGHVSSGDTYENAAIRELQEELGIINKNLTFMTKTIITYPKETEYVSYYKITIPKDQKIIINNEEISEYKFVAIKELISTYNDMQLTPDFEYIISHYL